MPSASAQFLLETVRADSWVLWVVIALMVAGGLVEAAWYGRKKPYPWREIGLSLPAGLAVSLWYAAVVAGLTPLYAWLSRFALFDLRLESALEWAALFALVDLGYYWHHRLAHRVRWMWALHAPHHSVQELTLFNSLRFSWSEATVGWLFMNVPAVLLGFPPAVVPVIYVVIGAYQYWIHSTLVSRLGPLEWLFATPSHHRVHHSTEERHLDRNFGGLLIVYDRLFGTFVPEGERMPRGYGIVGRSFDRLYDVVLGELAAMGREVRAARGLGAKLKVAFGRP